MESESNEATVIYLARRLLGGSSDLPESRNGPDQPCSLIWPCSRWGLPSQPVTRLLVRSYLHLFTLTLVRRPGRYTFCCTFPILADGGRYPPPCPVEPGLS